MPDKTILRTSRDLGFRGLNLVLESVEEPRAVAGTLAARLRAAGWSMIAEAAVDEAVFSSWRKGERSVAVGISRAGGVTQVGISVVERPFAEGEG